jgi:ABC-type amino acid transport substrate-binding protein
MAHDVFISYASEDKPLADAICSTLEAHKIRCWIAPRDVLPGTSWGSAIIQAIEEARILVMVFTSNSNESPQVMREVERAVKNGLTIIPFRKDDIVPSKQMEYFIASCHWLDAMDPPLERHLKNLANSVLVLLDRAPETLPPSEDQELAVPGPQEAPHRVAPKRSSRLWRVWLPSAAAMFLVIFLVWFFYLRPGPQTLSPPTVDLLVPSDGASVLGPMLKFEWKSPTEKGHNLTFDLKIDTETGKSYVRKTSALSHIETGTTGAITWQVQAVYQDPSGKAVAGPWSAPRRVTYYPNSLKRVLTTANLKIGTAELHSQGHFVWKQESTLGGFEVDLLRVVFDKVFEKHGVRKELKIENTWAIWGENFFKQLQDPSVDLLLSGISINEDREKKYGVTFSEPTVVFPQTIVALRSAAVWSSGQLLVTRLAVRAHTTNAMLARRILGSEIEKRLSLYKGSNAYYDMLKHLIEGKIDGFLLDKPYAINILNRFPDLKKQVRMTDLTPDLSPMFKGERIGFAFRRSDRELIDAVNQALRSSGKERKELIAKHFLGILRNNPEKTGQR